MNTNVNLHSHRHVFRLLVASAAMLSMTLLGFTLLADRPAIVSLVSDDAYYYLKVAQNLATSGMSSFDRITHTTGYHPLYAGLLALCYRVLQPDPDAFVRLMLFGNVLLNLLAAYFLFLAGSRLHHRTTGIWAALFFLLNPSATLWPLTGMEASLNGCLLAGFFASLARHLSDRVPCTYGASALRSSALGFVAGLAVMARIDNYAVVVLAGLVIVSARPYSFGQRIVEVAVFMLLPSAFLLLWFGYCHHVSGEWLQGSARMKAFFRGMETTGFSATQITLYTARLFADFVITSVMKVPALKYVLALGGTVLVFAKRESAQVIRMMLLMFMTLPLFLGCCYATQLPSVQTWYYVPSVLGLTLVAAYSVSALSQERLVNKRPGLLMLLAGLVILEGAVGTSVKLVRGRNRGQRDMLAVSEMLADKVPGDSRIGAWNAGIYGYYSGLTVINLDGLINDEISRCVRHGRVNWPYWLDRQIDYLVDREQSFQGVALRYNDAELHKVFEYQRQYGSKAIVLYKITRRSDPTKDEPPGQQTSVRARVDPKSTEND